MYSQLDPYGRRRSQAANPFTKQPEQLPGEQAMSRAFSSPYYEQGGVTGGSGVAPFGSGSPQAPPGMGPVQPMFQSQAPPNLPRPIATPPPQAGQEQPEAVPGAGGGGTTGFSPTGMPQTQVSGMLAGGTPPNTPDTFNTPPGTTSAPGVGAIVTASPVPSPTAFGGVGSSPYSHLPGFDQINGWYHAYLGREASLQDYYTHTTNGQFTAPQNMNAALQGIMNSPEAVAYQQKQNAPVAPPVVPDAPVAAPATGAAPGTAPAPQGSTTAPPGWDQTKWSDPTKHDPKYDYGHIASGYAGGGITPDEMPLIFDAIKKLYPKATWDGGDGIDFGDGYGPIDVVQGYKTGSGSPQWMPVSDADAAPTKVSEPSQTGFMSQMMGGSPAGGGSLFGDPNSYSAKILQYLMSQLGLSGAFGAGGTR